MWGLKELEREVYGKVISQGLERKVRQGKRRQRAGDMSMIAPWGGEHTWSPSIGAESQQSV